MRERVKNRNRYDVRFFWPDGASARWTSNPARSLTPLEMVKCLEDIISVIRPEPVTVLTTTGTVNETHT